MNPKAETNKKIRILVADDERPVIEAITLKLGDKYDITSFTDAAKAVKHLEIMNRKDLEPEFRYAVAVIDLRFEVLGEVLERAGIEILLEAVKDKLLEPIILTGHGTEDLAEEASDIGMFRYIKKSKKVVSTSISRLKSAIDDAVKFRDGILGYRGKVDEFYRKMIVLRQAGTITREQADVLGKMHEDAEAIYQHMLSARRGGAK